MIEASEKTAAAGRRWGGAASSSATTTGAAIKRTMLSRLGIRDALTRGVYLQGRRHEAADRV